MLRLLFTGFNASQYESLDRWANSCEVFQRAGRFGRFVGKTRRKLTWTWLLDECMSAQAALNSTVREQKLKGEGEQDSGWANSLKGG
jgi:hypothetical protein